MRIRKDNTSRCSCFTGSNVSGDEARKLSHYANEVRVARTGSKLISPSGNREMFSISWGSVMFVIVSALRSILVFKFAFICATKCSDSR